MYGKVREAREDEGRKERQRFVGYTMTMPLSSPCLFSTAIHAMR
jgi:hypothetical protein